MRSRRADALTARDPEPEKHDHIPRWIPEATPARIDEIGQQKEDLYRRLMRAGGLDPLPGVRHWIEILAREGWLQAIASSAPRENVDAVLAVIGWPTVSRPSFPPKMSRSASPTPSCSSPPLPASIAISSLADLPPDAFCQLLPPA